MCEDGAEVARSSAAADGAGASAGQKTDGGAHGADVARSYAAADGTADGASEGASAAATRARTASAV